MQNFVLALLAIFLPPLAVALEDGIGPHFFISVALCLLLWIPAVLHAWYIVFSR